MKKNRLLALVARLALALVILLGLVPVATATNPPPVQYYYISLAEDALLTLFDENQDIPGNFAQVISPIRSVSSISIAETGTFVYYDQWEDGAYDSDIANPSNLYSSSNLSGTQIWGDGILSNGCPPSINYAINPCAVAADDQLSAGDVIILDNDVTISSSANDDNVLDTFSSVAYNNNNGSVNWASNWDETGDNDNAASGQILITNNQLRFADADAGDYIVRAVSMPAAAYIPLKFTIGYNAVETTGDTFRVDVSPNAGTNWVTIATYGDGSLPANGSSQEINIATWAGPDTLVRFYQANSPDTDEYWYVDDVEIELGAYYRDPNLIFYDGRDKVGASTPVAMSRGAFPPTPGSMMAGATEMFDTSQWGTSYVAPLGEDTLTGYTQTANSFEDVRFFIMAGYGGATISVDANADGDYLDANDLSGYSLTEGGRVYVDGILQGATLTSNNPVQVNLMTGDDNDTFEFRWDALLPRPNWGNDYLTPVGTNPNNAEGCTEVWVYNPHATTLTIYYDHPGGNVYPTQDGSFTVGANDAERTPLDADLLVLGNGARFWSSDGREFLPISDTSCTRSANGYTNDWGTPLVPIDQLTDQVLVGWAPGCSNESHSGICHDPDTTPGGTTPDNTANEYSRNVVWVTAATTTTIYVDTNGSGITCPGGAGAEQTISVGALQGVRIDDDPTSRAYVHDLFSTQSYTRDDIVDGWDGTGGRDTPNPVLWTSDWVEGGGETTSPTAGAIQIETTNGTLRLQELAATDESGRWIQRTHNTSGSSYARLSFELYSSTGLDANDRIAAEVSSDGTNWFTLDTFVGPWVQTIPKPNFPVTEQYNISSHIANPTYIRFRFVDALETGDWWAIDHAHIDYAVGGDFDMTAAFIRTCDGTPIVASYGQEPSLSTTNDDEALDLGTFVPPYKPPKVKTGTIGNYVWLDEDGDGDQDAGEVGIPNVLVTITKGTTTYTTYTDANGGYLFTDLEPGGWTVTVTPPTGLNATYDENSGTTNPDNTTNVSLQAGEEHLTADFGYNWSTATETNTNTGTGAIGDRVWIDADGKGDQDAEEIGLAGVGVVLTYDSNNDGVIDKVYGTTTTDANGNYIFDNLPAGIYEVIIYGNQTLPSAGDAAPTSGYTPTGYTQTGDADNWGQTCATCDNMTTTPIVLGPGDVFVNADFGYQPTGDYGSIGDTVWLDADRNGTLNGNEEGIPSVTVALIKDLDGDGTWDAGEPIIATDITDENGQYLFTGLPVTDGTGTDDYLVWVNDTDNVLGELEPVYDVRDGGSQGNPTTGLVTGLEISAVTDLTTTAVTNADFAYAPAGHDSGEGIIGDTVFLDRDNDGQFDVGEGIEGVTVQLLTGDGLLLASTTTDENGNYSFGGLAAGTYLVRVDTTTLPGSGLSNTVDPDGGTANQSSVTIGSGGINLAQDFGYRDTSSPNAIGGTIWEDVDADGTLVISETFRFAGVSVDLYEDSNGNGKLDGGDALVGTAYTDSNGDYYFDDLPDGTYLVDVTDEDNILNGYWKSNGTNTGVDNNSQIDPYLVSVSGGETDTTGDFGYYVKPSDVGNFVFYDVDGDGYQDAGEPGIAGAEVTLTITYPNGTTTVIKTTTDSTGWYGFGNLLLDEDYEGVGTYGSGGNEPQHVITVATPSGYIASPSNVTGVDDAFDSDNGIAGEQTQPVQGGSDLTNDFGFYQTDWGDAPNSYLTNSTADGPRHIPYPDTNADGLPNTWNGDPAIWLGANASSALDFETDGQPSTGATGDGSDEDGVSLVNPTSWYEGTDGATIEVDLSSSSSGSNSGYLVVWFDWNHDGDFADAGEMVVSQAVNWTGNTDTQQFTFDIPTGGLAGDVYYRARLFDSVDDVPTTPYAGLASNGEVEDYWAKADTLPVTLAYFEAKGTGNKVQFRWSTSTAVNNAGFNLYVETEKGRRQINDELIPSNEPNSLETQEYKFVAEVSGEAFYLEEVAANLESKFFGPFELGKLTGKKVERVKVNWDAIRSEHEAKVAQRAVTDAARTSRLAELIAAEQTDSETRLEDESTAKAKKPAPVLRIAELRVSQSGIYRVTYETLLAAGLDLRGASAANLALTNRGAAVPIRVVSGPRFGSGSFIEFIGQALDTIYTDTNVYTLWLDRASALRIAEDNKAAKNNTPLAPYYMETTVVNRQLHYNYAAQSADPWYDTSMLAYAGKPKTYTFSVELDNLAEGPASTLAVGLLGVTNFTQSQDHHVVVEFNGKPVADVWFDGRQVAEANATLPPGGVVPDKNTLVLKQPADLPAGVAFDMAALDRWSVTYPRAFVARDGRLSFTASAAAFQVTGLPGKDVVVYRLSGGVPVLLRKVSVSGNKATFAGHSSEATYEVSAVGSLLTPSIQPVWTGGDLQAGPAQYLVIAHPDFIGAELDLLVQARQAQGLSVKVVDVRDLYAAYSYGILDAEAIHTYIQYAAANLGTQYVLLVGGDTYDYRNYLGYGSLSFIPSLYAATDNIVTWAPVDPLYADTSGDGLPDLAIGRLPVRTTAELATIVAKTLGYASKDYGKTAVFAADARFGSLSNGFVGQLPDGWAVQKAYVDEAGVSAAKAALIGKINEGVALTTFTGHSDDYGWTFNGLFDRPDAIALTNYGRPTVVTQWGCWNTYTVDPQYDTLGHVLMLSGSNGGAAVLGATTLSYDSSERALGDLLTPRMVQPGVSLGAALQAAKAELALTRPGAKDVLLGWTLLGDPALVVQP